MRFVQSSKVENSGVERKGDANRALQQTQLPRVSASMTHFETEASSAIASSYENGARLLWERGSRSSTKVV